MRRGQDICRNITHTTKVANMTRTGIQIRMGSWIWIHIEVNRWIPIRIRIKVERRIPIRIRIKVKIQKL